jgi:hypothetical protein
MLICGWYRDMHPIGLTHAWGQWAPIWGKDLIYQINRKDMTTQWKDSHRNTNCARDDLHA